jgi:hypothetical protein
MKFIERFWLWKAYFTRGHANYFMMIITMWNFVVIQFELLFKEELRKLGIYISIIDFTLLLIISYFPVVALIGRYDFKNPTGAVQVEQKLIMEISPIYRKVYGNQENIEKKLDVVLETLEVDEFVKKTIGKNDDILNKLDD